MRTIKNMLIGLISVVFLCGAVGLLTPNDSRAARPTTTPPDVKYIGVASDGFITAAVKKPTNLAWQLEPGVPGNTVSNCDNGNVCTWQEAVDYCAALGDGSRLPEIKELLSLVDFSVASPGPVLQAGHPFINVQSFNYWSATESAADPTNAWNVFFGTGRTVSFLKTNSFNVWCVR